MSLFGYGKYLTGNIGQPQENKEDFRRVIAANGSYEDAMRAGHYSDTPAASMGQAIGSNLGGIAKGLRATFNPPPVANPYGSNVGSQGDKEKFRGVIAADGSYADAMKAGGYDRTSTQLHDAQVSQSTAGRKNVEAVTWTPEQMAGYGYTADNRPAGADPDVSLSATPGSTRGIATGAPGVAPVAAGTNGYYEAPTRSRMEDMQNPYGAQGAYGRAIEAKMNQDASMRIADSERAIRERGAQFGNTARSSGVMQQAIFGLDAQRASESANNARLAATDLTKIGADFDMNRSGSLDNYALARGGQTPSYVMLPGQVTAQQNANRVGAADASVAEGTIGARTAAPGIANTIAQGQEGRAAARSPAELQSLILGNDAQSIANRTAGLLQPYQVQQAQAAITQAQQAIKAGRYDEWLAGQNEWVQTLLRLMPGIIQAGATYAGRAV